MTCKEATRETLLEYRATHSLIDTIQMASRIMLTGHGKDNFQFAADLHGEICETVLELIVSEFVRQGNLSEKGWSYWKGLILKDRTNPKSKFLTEIDFTVFSPKCVYIFECKSYAGNKTLTGEGLLTREDGKQYDVFKQSSLHLEALYPWLEGFTLPGKTPVIQMCMFNFSRGVLADRRTKSKQLQMPCLEVATTIEYLSKPGEAVWNTKLLSAVGEKLDKFSKTKSQEHLKYVKGLHGENRRS